MIQSPGNVLIEPCNEGINVLPTLQLRILRPRKVNSLSQSPRT